MLKLLASFAVVSGKILPDTAQREHMLFEEWLEIFGDEPNAISATKSRELRLKHYNENVEKIKAHNAMGHPWRLGVNAYADLTLDEFSSLRSKKMCSHHMQKSQTKNAVTMLGATKKELRNPKNPKSVDWRDHGAVTSVKTQGGCGSCWSFATTGAVEGAWKLAGGNVTDLSEQQLIDCNTGKIYGEEPNNGCKGGSMDPAFKYIMDNGGLTSAKNYPYAGAQSSTCDMKLAKESIVNLKGYVDVNVGDEMALENALAITPVALGIEADQTSFQLYSSGVFAGKCGTKLDHGVLAVGYGEDDGKKYWIVKNSWGTTWGEKGYIRIGRGLGGDLGLCGVLSMPTYPKVKEGSFLKVNKW